MEDLTRKHKILIIDRVLEEMNFAEKNLESLRFSWVENCSGVRCNDFNKLTIIDLKMLEKKYDNNYELSNYFDRKSNEFLPLRKVELVDSSNNKYTCEFENISWYGVNSKRSKRIFNFYNNGNIYYEKSWLGKLSMKKPKSVSYNLSYNILDEDYQIEYFEKYYNSDKFNDITFCYKDNKFLKILNNINIEEDLNNESKKVIVSNNRKRGRYNISTNLLINLNLDNTLKSANLVSNIKKEREDGVKTYIFSVDENGIIAKHIDDGKVTDLSKNPLLIDMGINLIVGGEGISLELEIVSEYLNSFLKTIKENKYINNIKINNFKCDFETLNESESKIINTIKEIKGEIPLKEFNDRFDKSLLKEKLYERR